MGLADRIVHAEIAIPYASGEAIPIHYFTASLELYQNGKATYNQIKNVFKMTDGEASGLLKITDKIDELAASGSYYQVQFIRRIDAAGMFYERGIIDKAQYIDIVGL